MILSFFKKSAMILFACFVLQGCGAIRSQRYWSGYNSGSSDYKKVKDGKYIGAWRSGYISGLAMEQAMNNLDKSFKDLEEALKSFNEKSKKNSERVKELLNDAEREMFK